MDLFIIGDVHGCFDTLTELLTHWKPATERLIQVGDLVDRGNHVPETVELARRLSAQYGEQAVFLKGNHEQGMVRHLGPAGPYKSWLDWGGRSTLLQYSTRRELQEPHVAWLAERGILAKDTHGSTVRFAPPLVASDEDIDTLISALAETLAQG